MILISDPHLQFTHSHSLAAKPGGWKSEPCQTRHKLKVAGRRLAIPPSAPATQPRSVANQWTCASTCRGE
jgi:hypothetical protein